jgi:hypothetical protein
MLEQVNPDEPLPDFTPFDNSKALVVTMVSNLNKLCEDIRAE